MDTRTKIVSLEAALEAARQARSAGKRVKLVTGYFDPLLLAHARKLQALASPDSVLFLVVMDPEKPLLPARARAEVAAGLAATGYVVIGAQAAGNADELQALLAALGSDEVYRDEGTDRALTRNLMSHVQSRYN